MNIAKTIWMRAKIPLAVIGALAVTLIVGILWVELIGFLGVRP